MSLSKINDQMDEHIEYKDKIPVWDGRSESLRMWSEAARGYNETVKYENRYLVGPQLVQFFKPAAKTIIRSKQSRTPCWLSHQEGVSTLIAFLEQNVRRPSLQEAAREVIKFFYKLRRRKGESMTLWYGRHEDTLWQATRTLHRLSLIHI